MSPSPPDFDTTIWTVIKAQNGIRIDIKYATTDNFMKQKVYDCGRCFLKPQVAKLLFKATDQLTKLNYGLIIYDCYRPAPIQYKLWKITPDKRFVAPPAKGSMHSKGLAIDLGLTNAAGHILDLGTDYDFFGPQAAPSFQSLSSDILNRRQVLREVFVGLGFVQARSEWWHFSKPDASAKLEEWQWSCPD